MFSVWAVALCTLAVTLTSCSKDEPSPIIPEPQLPAVKNEIVVDNETKPLLKGFIDKERLSRKIYDIRFLLSAEKKDTLFVQFDNSLHPSGEVDLSKEETVSSQDAWYWVVRNETGTLTNWSIDGEKGKSNLADAGSKLTVKRMGTDGKTYEVTVNAVFTDSKTTNKRTVKITFKGSLTEI